MGKEPKPEFRLAFPRNGHLGGPQVGVIQATSEDREYSRLKKEKKKKRVFQVEGTACAKQ